MKKKIKKKILAIIPARMESSRFPGKPMKKINGIPMIEMVYRNIKKTKNLHDTIVATCNYEIHNYILSINGKSIMTSNKHNRASERCAEALLKYEKKNKCKIDIVVLVQGDEPLIDSNMVHRAIKPLVDDNKILCSNLVGKIKNLNEFNDPNCIKVVSDKKSNAIYFSRLPIPFQKKFNTSNIKKQVCAIPFQRDFLIKYLKMKPTNLEILESIDMLRLLENNIKIKLVKVNKLTQSVDNLNDLKKAEKLIKYNESK